MRSVRSTAFVITLLAGAAAAQVHIQRVVPRILGATSGATSGADADADAGLRQRIRAILDRQVQTRFEYEYFIRDLTALGRPAVPHILAMVGRGVSDRYVTEVLLRIGGPEARAWIREVQSEADVGFREAFLSGVPALRDIDGSVRPELRHFLHDLSPRVRAAAVRRFHTLVPAAEMLVRCRDMHRDVVRAALEVVSDRWLFLDHGERELAHLQVLVGILEMHAGDDRWDIGRGFALALRKDRIAATPAGKALAARVAKLPWFASRARGVTAAQLAKVRAELAEGERVAAEVVAAALRDLGSRAGAELLLVLADSPEVRIRLAACEAGLRLVDPELAAAFVHFLKDPDASVRNLAKRLLETTSFYADQRQRWGAARRL